MEEMIGVRPISLNCVILLSYGYYLIYCSSTSLHVLQIRRDSLMTQ